MNEDSRNNGVLSGALGIATTAGAGYGAHAALTSDAAKRYAKNHKNIRGSLLKGYNSVTEDIAEVVKKNKHLRDIKKNSDFKIDKKATPEKKAEVKQARKDLMNDVRDTRKNGPKIKKKAKFNFVKQTAKKL